MIIGSTGVVAIAAAVIAVSLFWVSWYEKYEPLPEEQWERLRKEDVYRYLSPNDYLTATAASVPSLVTLTLVPRSQGILDWNKPKACYAYLGHQAKGAFLNHAAFSLSRRCRHAVIRFPGSELTSTLTPEDFQWRARDGALAILKETKINAYLYGPVNPFRARNTSAPPF